MISEQFQILDAFSSAINVELTINQIAKIIKKSYAFTNKYTHELIEQRILKKKEVGSAILCSLDYSNEATIGCLIYNSINKKLTYIKSSDTKGAGVSKTRERLDNLRLPESNLAFVYGGKLFIVGNPEKGKSTDASFISHDSFVSELRSYDFSKILILQGYEYFWKTVSKVVL